MDRGNTAVLIQANGGIKIAAPKNGRAFTIAEMQKLVGGYVEYLITMSGQVMVVAEEGRLMGLPENEKATLVYGRGDFVVGNVLVGDKKLFN